MIVKWFLSIDFWIVYSFVFLIMDITHSKSRIQNGYSILQDTTKTHQIYTMSSAFLITSERKLFIAKLKNISAFMFPRIYIFNSSFSSLLLVNLFNQFELVSGKGNRERKLLISIREAFIMIHNSSAPLTCAHNFRCVDIGARNFFPLLIAWLWRCKPNGLS